MENKYEEMLERFHLVYDKKRLLAVQFDGFTHRVVFDDGTQDSDIVMHEFSHYAPEIGWDEQASQMFYDMPHTQEATEIVYVRPDQR